MTAYNYSLLQLRTCARFPRTRCWCCEVLLPALQEGYAAEAGTATDVVESAGAMQRDVRRCREISGVAMPDAHHVVEKSWLRREYPHGVVRAAELGDARATWRPFDPRLAYLHVGEMTGGVIRKEEPPVVSLDELLMDERNCVPVARYHHDALTNARLRVPRRLVPAGVLEFVAEFDLQVLFDSRFPEEAV